MRRDNPPTHKALLSHEWVLGDFSREETTPLRAVVSKPTLLPSHRSLGRSPTISLAAMIAFLVHLVALFFLWHTFHPIVSEQVSTSAPVTAVELVPPLDSVPTTLQSEPAAQPSIQDFQATALARVESLERTLTQAVTQQAATEAAHQQDRDALATAQVTLQGQVASLVEEKAELAARLDSERQRNLALAQRVQEIQQARDQELQGMKGTYDRLVAALQGEIAQKEIALHQAKEKLTVTIPDRILFPSGQATLTPDGERIIAKVGVILAKVAGQRLLIEGHTDNVPIGATLSMRFPSNWELSSARAAEVVKYLITHAHLSSQQLSAVGRADTSPVASNATEEGRQLNRRIEIIVLP